MNDLVRWSVGQVWQTSRGYLWHVVEITPAGQAVLRRGRYGRKQLQTTVPRMWSLYQPNNEEVEMVRKDGDEVDISKVSNARLDWSRVLEALEAASAALEDLGACDDPACRDCNCNHALTKVRDVLSQNDKDQ